MKPTLGHICRETATEMEGMPIYLDRLQEEIKLFEDAINCAIESVVANLDRVSQEVKQKAAEHLRQHRGQGVVYIDTYHNGSIWVGWTEFCFWSKEETGSWDAPHTTVMVKDLLAHIEGLRQKVHDGHCEAAVMWLQANGREVCLQQ